MSPADIVPSAVYRRTLRPEAISPELRLRAVEWGVLFASSGQHSVAQIGAALSLSGDERDRVFRRLVALGLLVERTLAFGEYVRAAASAQGDEARSLAEFLRGAPAQPDAAPVLATPAPEGATRLDGESAVLGPSPAARPVPPPFRPLPLPAKESAMSEPGSLPSAAPNAGTAASRTLRLRALLDFVVGRAPDVEQGQLDVYRAFLKVEPKLLRRNGITTLRFEDDRKVTDPELVAAIVTSVEEAIGARCPAELFE